MNHPSPSAPEHGTPHPGDHDAGHSHHGSLRGYLTGFVLAAILTIIPFWLVMGHAISSSLATILIVLGLAVVQIVVHVVYFLHLDTRSESGWNMLAFIFTIVLVVIVLGASVWVMYNENANMMPMSPQYTNHRQGS
ncbi:MAG: cytochrome o ubiquinol oxidase subunit IV [Xanthomonadaceae bacterium]|nr:cytochrome o ubiquinol oxidase subunit IV [Xanthomonadaceae bacterium]